MGRLPLPKGVSRICARTAGPTFAPNTGSSSLAKLLESADIAPTKHVPARSRHRGRMSLRSQPAQRRGRQHHPRSASSKRSINPGSLQSPLASDDRTHLQRDPDPTSQTVFSDGLRPTSQLTLVIAELPADGTVGNQSLSCGRQIQPFRSVSVRSNGACLPDGRASCA